MLLIVFLLVPSARGVHNVEWLFGVGLTYFELILSLGLVLLLTHWIPSSMPVEIALGLGCAVGSQVGLGVLKWLFAPQLLRFEGEPDLAIVEVVGNGCLLGFLVFGLWVLAFRYPKIVARDAALDSEAKRLRLVADQQEMRARLAPHFLLNTLNAIAGMVGSDPASARRTISVLGDLLRASLTKSSEDLHTVGDEFESMKNYAQILHVRYGDRIRFEWKLADEVLTLRIPRLLIQPLVENAVLHGALRTSGPSTVVVAACLDQRHLIIQIENDGALGDLDKPESHGVSVVQRRLSLFAKDSSLRFDTADGKTKATLHIMIAT